MHFIEDLHQPLHVGDTGIRGGNDIQVRFFDIGSNLHRVWDSQIIERHSADEDQWFQELRPMTNQTNVAEWLKGRTVIDWANESLGVAKMAYFVPGTNQLLKPGTKLGEDYYRFALPIVRQQLAKAGFRVAATLNNIFK